MPRMIITCKTRPEYSDLFLDGNNLFITHFTIKACFVWFKENEAFIVIFYITNKHISLPIICKIHFFCVCVCEIQNESKCF